MSVSTQNVRNTKTLLGSPLEGAESTTVLFKNVSKSDLTAL